jgi:hypothetical protein
MGLWEAVRGWFKREAADLAEAKDELEDRLDADLGRRERQLTETPDQAMGRIQDEIHSDSSFTAISDKIEAAAARATAEAEAEAESSQRPVEIDPEFLDRHQNPDGSATDSG